MLTEILIVNVFLYKEKADKVVNKINKALVLIYGHFNVCEYIVETLEVLSHWGVWVKDTILIEAYLYLKLRAELLVSEDVLEDSLVFKLSLNEVWLANLEHIEYKFVIKSLS